MVTTRASKKILQFTVEKNTLTDSEHLFGVCIRILTLWAHALTAPSLKGDIVHSSTSVLQCGGGRGWGASKETSWTENVKNLTISIC